MCPEKIGNNDIPSDQELFSLHNLSCLKNVPRFFPDTLHTYYNCFVI